MKAVVLVALVGCGFSPTTAQQTPSDGSFMMMPLDGPPDGARDGGMVFHDAPAVASTCWSWTPTNFDSCSLPTPAPLSVTSGTTTIDTDTPGTLPSKLLTQGDGSHLLVIHLTSLDVANGATLSATGSLPLVLAVDGTTTIEGAIRTHAGADDVNRCATRAGVNGASSSVDDTGGGGAGGGGGADQGGDGTDGADGTHPSGAGAHGGHGVSLDDGTLSPLPAGCPGGTGGQMHNTGTAGSPGGGGGAIQISAQTSITVSGSLNAAGTGAGGTAAQTGGGGGGSGGAVFLESLAVTISNGSNVCADGGAGSEGGGSSNTGANGGDGACNGQSGATTNVSNQYGGNGGTGGYSGSTAGGGAGPASNNSPGGHGAGGGGGGGAVGWIRFHVVGGSAMVGTAVVTPAATN